LPRSLIFCDENSIGKIEMLKFIIFILFVASGSSGQLKLSDVQSGVFDAATYIVTKDLIVPEGKTLEILPGSKIKIKPYVGIKVFGILKLRETELSAIDSLDEQWNGVEVAFNGRIDFEDVVIDKSVKGVIVPDSSSIIKFNNVLFKDNRKGLQIANMPVLIKNGQPVTIVIENEKHGTVDTKYVLRSEQPPSENTMGMATYIVRWGTSISTVALTGVSLYSVVRSDYYVSKYDEVGEDDIDQFPRLRESITRYNKYATIASILAGVSALGFVCTFAF